jgi:hypothetical protein
MRLIIGIFCLNLFLLVACYPKPQEADTRFLGLGGRVIGGIRKNPKIE